MSPRIHLPLKSRNIVPMILVSIPPLPLSFTFRQQSSRVACVQLTPFANSVSIPCSFSVHRYSCVCTQPRYEIAFSDRQHEKSFSIEMRANIGREGEAVDWDRSELGRDGRNLNYIIKFNNEAADDKGHRDK